MGKSEEEKKQLGNGKKELEKVDNPVPFKEEISGLPIPQEILDKIPAKDREEVKGFLKSSMSFSAIMGQFPNPMMQKITPEHISDIIKNTHETDQRDRDERKHIRWYVLIALLAAMAVLVFFVIFLVIYNKVELLTTLITIIVAIAGGFGAGWGLRDRFKD